MTIRVLFFAALAQRLGTREVSLAAPEGASVGGVMGLLVERFPDLAEMRDRVATAVNLTYVRADAVLAEGDELALIPPVSGG